MDHSPLEPPLGHLAREMPTDHSIQRLLMDLQSSTSANQIQMHELISSLPRLTERDIIALGHQDSVCPICFTPFLALLAEEEMALAMDSPAHPVEELGVTRLAKTYQCGHVFCRRDLVKWTQDIVHDSCPTCRHPLLEPRSSPQPDTTQEGSLAAVAMIQAVNSIRDLAGSWIITDDTTGQTPNSEGLYARQRSTYEPDGDHFSSMFS